MRRHQTPPAVVASSEKKKRKDDYWLAIKLSFYSNSDCPSNNLLSKRWKEYKWGKLLSKGQSAH